MNERYEVGAGVFRIAALWRYPVKSLGGERLEAGEVGPHGLDGDRAFGLVDEASGKVLTARREPRLLFATASWHDGQVAIVVDGQHLDSDAALSAWLDRPVRLARAGTEGGVYESPQDDEDEAADWHTWQGPGQAWHDSGRTRVSLVSVATLGDWAPQRFRPNVLLDDGADEDALVGMRVQLGTTVLAVTTRIGRCVVVTRAQPDAPTDREVLRTIHRQRDGRLAIGAVVEESGAVAVGDRLVPADGA